MEIRGKVHCLFEQSGTFKKEFIKFGISAEDYDIQNNFGETDHIVDLFAEIEYAWGGQKSMFDNFSQDDLLMAFFPCIYFCENNQLFFTGNHLALKNMSNEKKERAILDRSRSRQYFYEMILKMFNVCTIRGLRLIVENPYHPAHFLYNNFPYKPTFIDTDRTRRGDCFRKPTQFWFHNCAPTEGQSYSKPKFVGKIQRAKSAALAGVCSEERSMISPIYARNFIADFILGKEIENSIPKLKFED